MIQNCVFHPNAFTCQKHQNKIPKCFWKCICVFQTGKSALYHLFYLYIIKLKHTEFLLNSLISSVLPLPTGKFKASFHLVLSWFFYFSYLRLKITPVRSYKYVFFCMRFITHCRSQTAVHPGICLYWKLWRIFHFQLSIRTSTTYSESYMAFIWSVIPQQHALLMLKKIICLRKWSKYAKNCIIQKKKTKKFSW